MGRQAFTQADLIAGSRETRDKLDHTLRAYGRLEQKHNDLKRKLARLADPDEGLVDGLAKAMYYRTGPDYQWEAAYGEGIRDYWREEARAAIAAIHRELSREGGG